MFSQSDKNNLGEFDDLEDLFEILDWSQGWRDKILPIQFTFLLYLLPFRFTFTFSQRLRKYRM